MTTSCPLWEEAEGGGVGEAQGKLGKGIIPKPMLQATRGCEMTIDTIATPGREVHRLITILSSVAVLHPTTIPTELKQKMPVLHLTRQCKRIHEGIILLLDGLPAHEANMPAHP